MYLVVSSESLDSSMRRRTARAARYAHRIAFSHNIDIARYQHGLDYSPRPIILYCRRRAYIIDD